MRSVAATVDRARALHTRPDARRRALLIALAASCGGLPAEPMPTQLVVGIQSEPMGGSCRRFTSSFRWRERSWTTRWSSPRAGRGWGSRSRGRRRSRATGRAARQVDVKVDAHRRSERSDPALHAPRRRPTSFPGASSLLRVPLESRCIVYPATTARNEQGARAAQRADVHRARDVHHGALPVVRRAPAARSRPTRRTGRPTRPIVASRTNGGPPALQVGTGQSYYLPLAGADAPGGGGPARGSSHLDCHADEEPEAGGVDHEGLGVQPGTGATIPPTTLAFTYAPDEGGFCKLYGHPLPARQRRDRLQASSSANRSTSTSPSPIPRAPPRRRPRTFRSRPPCSTHEC